MEKSATTCKFTLIAKIPLRQNLLEYPIALGFDINNGNIPGAVAACSVKARTVPTVKSLTE